MTKDVTKITCSEMGMNIYDTPGFGDLEELSDVAIFAKIIQKLVSEEGTSASLDGIVILQPAEADRF